MRGSRRTGPAGVLLAAAALACEPGPVLVSTDALVFEPGRVELGLLPVDEPVIREVQLVNRGTVPLRVRRVDLGETSLRLEAVGGDPALVGRLLRPNRPEPVQVVFTPRDVGAREVAARVETDAVGAELAVVAEVVRVGAPDLRVAPASVDWGDVIAGEPTERSLAITNRGPVPTRLVLWSSAAPVQVEPAADDRDASPLLGPGDTVALRLRIAPEARGAFDDEIELALSGGARVRVPVRGRVESAGEWACPDAFDFGALERGEVRTSVLTCEAEGGAVRTASVRLLAGSAPAFEIDRWTEPAPGQAQIALRYAAFGLAGVEAATLRIETSHGTAVDVPVSAETRPPPPGAGALSATLTWDTTRVDLDLHLVRSGAEPFAPGEDCYWADKNPGWGEPDRFFDDPFLDRDATQGLEPEEVNLTQAGESRYDLYVQYHAFEALFEQRPATATVEVTLRDQAPVRRTRRLERCGSMWHVARIVDGQLEWVDAVDDRFRELAAVECR